MNVRRKFERQGPLWVPKYYVDPPLDRFKRYRRRFPGLANFTERQSAINFTGNASTLSASLTNNPVAGNVVCVAVTSSNGGAVLGVVVKDGASTPNTYTNTTHSPSTFLSGAGQIWLAYFIANATANKTITVTCTNGGGTSYGFIVEEFTVAGGGTAAYDKDATAELASGGTTAVNTPSITPAGTGELLYAATTVLSLVTHPTAGQAAGNWTGSAAGLIDSGLAGAEYQLNAGTAQAVNYTASSGNTGWSGMAMAFTWTASSTPLTESLSDNADNDNW